MGGPKARKSDLLGPLITIGDIRRDAEFFKPNSADSSAERDLKRRVRILDQGSDASRRSSSSSYASPNISWSQPSSNSFFTPSSSRSSSIGNSAGSRSSSTSSGPLSLAGLYNAFGMDAPVSRGRSSSRSSSSTFDILENLIASPQRALQDVNFGRRRSASSSGDRRSSVSNFKFSL